MQYKVLKIEEDIDFGCEERQPGEEQNPAAGSEFPR